MTHNFFKKIIYLPESAFFHHPTRSSINTRLTVTGINHLLTVTSMITWGTITLVISIGQRFTAGSIGARVGKAGITFCSDSRWHVICVGYFKIQNILFHHIDFFMQREGFIMYFA